MANRLQSRAQKPRGPKYDRIGVNKPKAPAFGAIQKFISAVQTADVWRKRRALVQQLCSRARIQYESRLLTRLPVFVDHHTAVTDWRSSVQRLGAIANNLVASNHKIRVEICGRDREGLSPFGIVVEKPFLGHICQAEPDNNHMY